MEKGELVSMKEGWGREGARKEVEGRGWSVGVEALESLKGKSSLHCQDLQLCRGKEKRGQAAEQLRSTVAGLNSQ